MKSRALKFLLMILLAAGGLCSSGTAQTGVFLKIGEIPGESKAAGHEKEIDINAWSWGVFNTGMAKAQWTRLNVAKYLDKATPKFMTFAAQGKTISNAVLSLTAGPSAQEYYRITLQDVRVTGVNPGGSVGVGAAEEEVAIAFSKMTVDYFIIGPDGKVVETTGANWNLLSNTGGSGGTTTIRASLTFAAGAPAGQLVWNAATGKTYEVQLSSLPQGPFTLFGTYASGTNTQMSVSVPFDGPRAFFRIRQL